MPTYRPLKRTDFPLVEALFGDKGACGGCWCMYFRVPQGGKMWEDMKGDPARAALQVGIETGTIRGILALEKGRAIGWCTYGPRTDFPRLERAKAYARPEDPATVWSIPCFYIDRQWRNQGVAAGLLAAALAAITKAGGSLVEGYPVPLTKAGERLPATFAFQGPLPMFEHAGFTEVQRHSHSRPLVQRNLVSPGIAQDPLS